MALMTALEVFVVGVLTAALSRILAEEIADLSSWVIRGLIRAAVAKLPENQRLRFAEEWHGHVDETPGRIGKLFSAVGFLIAAHKMAMEDERNQFVQHWLQTVAQLEASDLRVSEVIELIEGEKSLSSNEALVTIVATLRGMMNHSAELQRKLIPGMNLISSISTSLPGRLLYGRSINGLRKGFDELSQVAEEKIEVIEQTRAEFYKLRELQAELLRKKRILGIG
jgi:hypothetical protein